MSLTEFYRSLAMLNQSIKAAPDFSRILAQLSEVESRLSDIRGSERLIAELKDIKQLVNNLSFSKQSVAERLETIILSNQ